MALLGKDTLRNQAASRKLAGRKARDDAYAARAAKDRTRG